MSLSQNRILTGLGATSSPPSPTHSKKIILDEKSAAANPMSDSPPPSLSRGDCLDPSIQEGIFSITAAEPSALSHRETEEKAPIRSFTALTEEVEDKFSADQRENAVNFMLTENYYIAYLKYIAHTTKQTVVMHHDAPSPSSVNTMLAHLTKIGIDPENRFSHQLKAPKIKYDKATTLVAIPLCYGKNLGRNTAKYFRTVCGSYTGVRNFDIYLTDIPAKFKCGDETSELQKWKREIETAVKFIPNLTIRVLTNSDISREANYIAAKSALDPFVHSATGPMEKHLKYDAYSYLLTKCDPVALAATKPDHGSDAAIDFLPLKALSALSSANIDPRYTQMMIESADRAIQEETARKGAPLDAAEKQRLMKDSIEKHMMFFQTLSDHLQPTRAHRPAAIQRFQL